MRYIPNTDEDLRRMLQEMGAKDVDDLFSDIPEKLRLKRKLDLPGALSEPELVDHLKNLSEKNRGSRFLSFLGAGSYDHFVPSVVPHLISRSEFSTAYTPYQPEISQGTLQGIYEYQTLICQLTGMEVANASMYDGASSLAEAVLMGSRIRKKKEFLISRALHPEYREVVHTYTRSLDFDIKEIPFNEDLLTDTDSLEKMISSETCAVVVQNPNFFGSIEDLKRISRIAKAKEAFFIVAVAEPISLGVLSPPGDFGCDIVVGEGQVFGSPVNYGGPSLGLFATREEHVRSMPGRLVGETVDKDGERGYVLTMATREQHIRREKATSNICTNESLCALAASVYLCAFGKSGLKRLAELNFQKAHYARQKISQLEHFTVVNRGPVFNEFVVKTEIPLERIEKRLMEEKIIGGLDLSTFYPEMKGSFLLCCTEKIKKEDIDRLSDALNSR
jgi:glycine dehydrogenase subunit 1